MQQHLEFVLHPPLWAAVFLVIVGFAVFVISTRRLDRTLGRVGIGLLLLGILAGIVGWFFPPNPPQMETHTKTWSPPSRPMTGKNFKLSSTLDHARNPLPNPSFPARATSPTSPATSPHTFGVKSASVYRISNIRTETLITVTVGVYSQQDISQDRPIFSNLQLDFAQSGNDWILQTITILSVDQRSGDEIANHLRNHENTHPRTGKKNRQTRR